MTTIGTQMSHLKGSPFLYLVQGFMLTRFALCYSIARSLPLAEVGSIDSKNMQRIKTSTNTEKIIRLITMTLEKQKIEFYGINYQSGKFEIKKGLR